MRVDVHVRTWQGHPPQFRALQDKGGEQFFRTEFALESLPDAWRSPWRREEDNIDPVQDETRGKDMVDEDNAGPATLDFRSLV